MLLQIIASNNLKCANKCVHIELKTPTEELTQDEI